MFTNVALRLERIVGLPVRARTQCANQQILKNLQELRQQLRGRRGVN